MSDKMREALKLADAALSGANMNMNVVKRKISEALAEQPAQGGCSGFGNYESAVETHTPSRRPAKGEALYTMDEMRAYADDFHRSRTDPLAQPAQGVPDWLPSVLDQHIAVAERSGWNGLHSTLTACRDALTAPPAPSVPDGWKLVPIEPTDDMEGTACHELRERGCPAKLSDIQVAWSVMLAAAPEVKS